MPLPSRRGLFSAIVSMPLATTQVHASDIRWLLQVGQDLYQTSTAGQKVNAAVGAVNAADQANSGASSLLKARTVSQTQVYQAGDIQKRGAAAADGACSFLGIFCSIGDGAIQMQSAKSELVNADNRSLNAYLNASSLGEANLALSQAMQQKEADLPGIYNRAAAPLKPRTLEVIGAAVPAVGAANALRELAISALPDSSEPSPSADSQAGTVRGTNQVAVAPMAAAPSAPAGSPTVAPHVESMVKLATGWRVVSTQSSAGGVQDIDNACHHDWGGDFESFVQFDIQSEIFDASVRVRCYLNSVNIQPSRAEALRTCAWRDGRMQRSYLLEKADNQITETITDSWAAAGDRGENSEVTVYEGCDFEEVSECSTGGLAAWSAQHNGESNPNCGEAAAQ